MSNHYNHNSIRCLRYIPVAAFLLMFIHVILLQLGIDTYIAELIVILLGYVIVYRFSITCGFCLMHRMLIYYVFTVMVCIWLRRIPSGEYGLFGHHILWVRIIMTAWGSILLVLLIIKHHLDHNHHNQ